MSIFRNKMHGIATLKNRNISKGLKMEEKWDENDEGENNEKE